MLWLKVSDARIIRSEILSLRERDYVAFARVAGVGSLTIFFRHLLPNIFNTLVVLMTLQVGQVTGSAPPSAPDPWQMSQVTEVGTVMVFWLPVKASSSDTRML